MNRRSALGVVAATALLFSISGFIAQDVIAKPAKPAGAVYTMTNDAAGNTIVIFDRDEKGILTPSDMVPTGGLGSGGGLDPLASQGSLVLTDDHRWLLAVNAGSNEISVFRVMDDGLDLVDIVGSGGMFPTSLTVFHDLVYVLNTGGTPNISGFMLNHKGELSPLAGSRRSLAAGLYSQVGFDPRGDVLVMAARTTNSLLVYGVGKDGTPSAAPMVNPSSGAGPFSFIFTEKRLLVAEVGANAVSSYDLQPSGSLMVVDPSVPNGQAATCWIVGAGNRYAFTANPGASSISSYRQEPGKKGDLTLLGGLAGTGVSPLDLAVSKNERFLYALDPGSGSIDAFQIGHDGGLTNLGAVPAGLPLYAQGLAAR